MNSNFRAVLRKSRVTKQLERILSKESHKKLAISEMSNSAICNITYRFSISEFLFSAPRAPSKRHRIPSIAAINLGVSNPSKDSPEASKSPELSAKQTDPKIYEPLSKHYDAKSYQPLSNHFDNKRPETPTVDSAEESTKLGDANSELKKVANLGVPGTGMKLGVEGAGFNLGEESFNMKPKDLLREVVLEEKKTPVQEPEDTGFFKRFHKFRLRKFLRGQKGAKDGQQKMETEKE